MSDEDDDEDDIPSIGDCCEGKVLVCIGDDEPDQWDDWLEELVDEFNSLRDAATAQGLLCRVGPKCLELGGWSDFCEEVGVDLNQEFWEGSLVSGQFVMGWVEKKKIGTARRRGGSLLKKLHSSLVLQLKAKRIEELKSFKGLEELISRTENDREALLEEVESLKSSLASAQAETSQLQGVLTAVKADVDRVNGLNGFLLGIIRGGDGIFVHGPLLRWSDGTILALTKRGRVGGVSLMVKNCTLRTRWVRDELWTDSQGTQFLASQTGILWPMVVAGEVDVVPFQW